MGIDDETLDGTVFAGRQAMSKTSWVVLDEYSFDGGETVEYRLPRMCRSKASAESRARLLEQTNRDEVGFVRCVVRPSGKVSVSLDSIGDYHGELARVRHLQEVTAEHLRKARTDLHNARYDVEHAERLLRDWAGNETGFERQHTPEHYMGDGLVTCSRALYSASHHPYVRFLPPMAAYWWGCAFKYLWRMWSKNDPESDAAKAKDCIGKAVRAWRS